MSLVNGFKIFVYGTLKHNQPNQHYLKDKQIGYSKYIANGLTKENFALVIGTVCNVPFLLDASGQGEQVKGEVYEVDDKLLEWLDEFEEHPSFYVRREIPIILNEPMNNTNLNIINCWAYLLPKFPPAILQNNTFYTSYDSCGSHKREYIRGLDKGSAFNYDDLLK